jgi:hypothetical protein
MPHKLERLPAPNEENPREFDPGETSFLEAESQFLTFHFDAITSALRLGHRNFIVLRDSTVLLGITADHSRGLLRERTDSFQDALDQLTRKNGKSI